MSISKSLLNLFWSLAISAYRIIATSLHFQDENFKSPKAILARVKQVSESMSEILVKIELDGEIKSQELDIAIDQLCSVSPQHLTPIELMYIYSQLCSAGFIESSIKVRELATAAALVILQNSKIHPVCHCTISLALEAGYFKNFEQYLFQLKKIKATGSRFKRLLSQGQVWFCRHTKENYSTKPSEEISKELKRRRVQVIGPIRIAEPRYVSAKNTDILIQLNIFENNMHKNLMIDEGIKTAYFYNKNKLNTLFQSSKNVKFPKDMSIIVVRKKKRWMKKELSINNAIFDDLNLALSPPIGSYRLLSLTLAYLIASEPRNIFVSNFDLNTSDNLNPKYLFDEIRKATSDTNLNRIKKAALSHDPLADFFLLRRFKELGCIDYDMRLQNILSLEPVEYMALVEQSSKCTSRDH